MIMMRALYKNEKGKIKRVTPIKNCFFCGSRSIIQTKSYGYGGYTICKKCGHFMPHEYTDTNLENIAYKKAVKLHHLQKIWEEKKNKAVRMIDKYQILLSQARKEHHNRMVAESL